MALADLQQAEVLMLNGHFDYGNGYHGRVYLNPHQLFRHPSTIWRFAQDLIDLIARREEWLVDRTIGYAKQYGYTPYTSTLAEAWRAEANRQRAEAQALAREAGARLGVEVTIVRPTAL